MVVWLLVTYVNCGLTYRNATWHRVPSELRSELHCVKWGQDRFTIGVLLPFLIFVFVVIAETTELAILVTLVLRMYLLTYLLTY